MKQWFRLPRIAAVLALALGLAACDVNAVPRQDEAVKAAWSQVLNQYQRRADLIPNLVNTVKGYAQQEQTVLIGVTEARAKATSIKVDANDPESLKKFQQVQGELSGALSRLLVVSENYPQLKSDQNFRDLQAQLEGTENRIAIARRRYIEAVQDYNNQLTVPPTSFTNSLFYHRTPKPQFTATSEGADKAPAVKF